MGKLNLLNTIKKINRSVIDRKNKKNNRVINISRKYGQEYFDGDRKFGYGGYKYDGRWISVAKRIKKIYRLNKNSRILDIGCADSTLLENLEETYNYNGYDLDNSFVNKSKNKYSHKKNFHFYNKSVDEIDFQKFNPENTLIVLIGLFHHINDNQIYNFINKTKNFKVIGIDAVKLSHQKNITKLLMALDRGKFIRKIDS